MKVWVLVLYFSGSMGGGPTVIDNLVSAQECQRLAEGLRTDLLVARARCYEAVKRVGAQ